jgi:acyl carrier protein
MATRDQVRDYIKKVLRENKDDANDFADGDSLVLTGRLSSLDVVDVLTYLEKTFGFEMDPSEFDLERFDSVDSILKMLEQSGASSV